ncbi:MAG: clan AA aspartic protease [Chloroflexota bacterium]|nr:clan AA aspartic protease [Chloroflexota bacterium]
MAEESGKVTASGEAVLRLRLSPGETVECLVDTGFTGALVLPHELVTRLNLPIVGREVFEMVGGRRFVAGVALAEVEWLGRRATFRVIVSEDTLIGTEMLDGCRLVIDYAAHTVTVGDGTN